jgi:hypothetical protein
MKNTWTSWTSTHCNHKFRKTGSKLSKNSWTPKTKGKNKSKRASSSSTNEFLKSNNTPEQAHPLKFKTLSSTKRDNMRMLIIDRVHLV